MHRVNRKKLPGLIAKYQKLLRAEDWQVAISDEMPAEENQAEIQPWNGKDGAWFRIQNETFDTPEQCIIHEIIHLNMYRMERFIGTVLKEHISDKVAQRVAMDEIYESMERFTDKMARVIDELTKEK